jgi:hypothetical protein
MGVWAEDGAVVWLPRSLYPKRIEAIRWAMHEWGVTLPEVSCLSRWMRYEPLMVDDFSPGWTDDNWFSECDKDQPGACRVWRLEAA